jgi:hypothetical protein
MRLHERRIVGSRPEIPIAAGSSGSPNSASDLKKEFVRRWQVAAEFKRRAEQATRLSERELCFELHLQWLRLAVAYGVEAPRRPSKIAQNSEMASAFGNFLRMRQLMPKVPVVCLEFGIAGPASRMTQDFACKAGGSECRSGSLSYVSLGRSRP